MKQAYWQCPSAWPISIQGSHGVVRFQTPCDGTAVRSGFCMSAPFRE